MLIGACSAVLRADGGSVAQHFHPLKQRRRMTASLEGLRGEILPPKVSEVQQNFIEN